MLLEGTCNSPSFALDRRPSKRRSEKERICINSGADKLTCIASRGLQETCQKTKLKSVRKDSCGGKSPSKTEWA